LTFARSLALLLPLALLAACGKSSDGNDRRSASGKVLPGTVSDAMLPLDKLKSQPPLLAPSERKTTPEGVDDETSSVGDVTSESSATPGEEDTAPAPVPSPNSSPGRGGGGPQG
jgi:hypothetical protein